MKIFNDQLFWAGEGVRHAKYIAMGVKQLKEHVENGTVRIVQCAADKMMADYIRMAWS